MEKKLSVIIDEVAKRYDIELNEAAEEKSGIYISENDKLINVCDFSDEEFFSKLFNQEITLTYDEPKIKNPFNRFYNFQKSKITNLTVENISQEYDMIDIGKVA